MKCIFAFRYQSLETNETVVVVVDDVAAIVVGNVVTELYPTDHDDDYNSSEMPNEKPS
jgi:hypothetical protein